ARHVSYGIYGSGSQSGRRPGNRPGLRSADPSRYAGARLSTDENHRRSPGLALAGGTHRRGDTQEKYPCGHVRLFGGAAAGAFSKSDSRTPAGQGAFRHGFPLCRFGESVDELRQAGAQRFRERKNPYFERARAVRTLSEKPIETSSETKRFAHSLSEG